MTVLTEGNLQLTIDGAAKARKFDDANHGLSHCMKAVDFIIELRDRYLFIEFKDPQTPDVPAEKRDEFIQEFQSGKLDETLKYKYRDSFLYEWAIGRADKPVHYLVLIALDSLSDAYLTTRREALEQKLPLQGPRLHPWLRPIVQGCGVFNIATWNKHFPQYPVERLKP